jgi:hypothetical protein
MPSTVGLLTRYYRLRSKIWLWQFHWKLRKMKSESVQEMQLEEVEIQIGNVTAEILREIEIISDSEGRYLHRLAELYT